MRRALGLAILLTGCSPWGTTEVPAAPAPSIAPGITLTLESTTVREAMTQFATAAGEPVAIDPAADLVATCAHVTLLVPAPRPATEVGALLGETLATHGFTFTHGASGWSLTHAGPRPPGCFAERPSLEEVLGTAPVPVADAIPADAVRSVNDTEVEVRREAFERWIESPSTSGDSVRIIPHMVDGETVGLALFGIRRASPPARLGLMNGDVVHTVNGLSVASMERALEAYSRLRNESLYRVELTRRGERITHTIRVVD